MTHLDLFSCLTYMTQADLTRIGSSLFSTGKTAAHPLGDQERIPGWYVRGYVNEAYTDIHKYTRVTDNAAERIARCIDDAVVPAGDTSRPLRDYVRNINAERANYKRKRLEALPAEIQRLEREQARLRDELATGGKR